MLDGTCNPVMNKSDKYYPKVPFIRNLFSVFEWQRLIAFLSISKLSVCGYILLSIVADILVVVAPALIIFSVTAGNSPAESNDFPANLIDTVPLYISFILAFLSIFLQQLSFVLFLIYSFSHLLILHLNKLEPSVFSVPFILVCVIAPST